VCGIGCFRRGCGFIDDPGLEAVDHAVLTLDNGRFMLEADAGGDCDVGFCLPIVLEEEAIQEAVVLEGRNDVVGAAGWNSEIEQRDGAAEALFGSAGPAGNRTARSAGKGEGPVGGSGRDVGALVGAYIGSQLDGVGAVDLGQSGEQLNGIEIFDGRRLIAVGKWAIRGIRGLGEGDLGQCELVGLIPLLETKPLLS